MKIVSHLTSAEKTWGKSKTPKRYLHPPFCENLVTLWRNSMLIIGEIMGGDAPHRNIAGKFNESALPSCGMVFLYKSKFLSVEPEIETRKDGIPIHAQSYNMGKFSLRMESFCTNDRVCTAYTKLTIKNNTTEKIADTIGFIARAGYELELVGSFEPDGYYQVEPSAVRWFEQYRWGYPNKNCTTNNIYSAYYQYDKKVQFRYDERLSCSLFDFNLDVNDKTELYFAIGRSKINPEFNYEKEKENVINFWNAELSRIKCFPDEKDQELMSIIKSLVAQILQMFAYPKGCNYVIVRQGVLQRRVWPTEARSGLRALAEIGDFEDYFDKAFNTYFNVMQSCANDNFGEIVNFGIPWGSVTGAVLYSFGCVIKRHPKIYNKYKDSAFNAFLWMESLREKTKKDPKLISGIFPPLRSSDYFADGQMWADTDVWNLQAYDFYIEGLKANNDPNYERVKLAREDYFLSMKAILDNAVKGQENNDIICLPSEAHNDPKIEEEIIKRIFSKKAECFRILGIGLAGYGTEIAEKILRRYYNEEEVKNGLVCQFQDSEEKGGKRWYVSFYEMDLYDYFRKSGQDQKAKELLDAQFNYSMTKEYYMAERYDDHDPNYFPWCPNCSANGRTISMVYDWFNK